MTALKKFTIRQYAFTFSPCPRKNYARKSAHNSYVDRFLEDCSFSIKFVNNARFCGAYSSTKIYMKRCVCDFQALAEGDTSTTIIPVGDKLYLDDSHINVDIRGAGTNVYLIYPYSQITNSYVTGYFHNGRIAYSPTLRHSYIAVEAGPSRPYEKPFSDGSCQDVCFYDNQLWSGSEDISVTGSGKLYGLPTAKCKDADYLNSIGFYVVPEE